MTGNHSPRRTTHGRPANAAVGQPGEQEDQG